MYILFFFIGASIGSFVQVVVTRLNVAPIVSSRSKCLSCGEALRASDLVPIFSYLVRRGKCKYCKVSYGIDSLVTEVAFGVLFILLYHFILTGLGFSAMVGWFLFYTLLFVSLGVIALYDHKHTYIPIQFLAVFLLLSLMMLGARYVHEPSYTVLLGPFIVAAPFLFIWVASKGKALGFGDVLLFLGVGAFFGIEQGLAVLLLSIWAGAIIGLAQYLYRKAKGVTNNVIPFVPFIVLAFITVLFGDIGIFSIVSLFQ